MPDTISKNKALEIKIDNIQYANYVDVIIEDGPFHISTPWSQTYVVSNSKSNITIPKIALNSLVPTNNEKIKFIFHNKNLSFTNNENYLIDKRLVITRQITIKN